MTRLNRIWFTLLVLAGILVLSSLQAGGSGRTIVGSQQPPVGSGSLQIRQPTGALATPPLGNYFDHLVVIMMENEGINDICGSNPPPCNGSNTPYMSSLANSYGISQQYLSLVITSWPNYYGILGAFLPSGCSTANPGPCYPPAGSLTNSNLIDRFDAAGLTWKGYMESQGAAAGCVTGGGEPYTHEHNGFVAFQDIVNNTSRCSKIVLANPSSCGSVTDCALINDLNSSSPPSFMWLTPNDCNDMRAWSGCSNGCTRGGSSTCIRKGDNYLNSLVPNILNSNTFATTRAALFITFDEGNDYCPLNDSSEDCLYAVWAGPVAKTGFSSAQLYNQYSLTKTIEVNWDLTSLTSNDASATPMTEFLRPSPNFTISATTPSPISVGQTANSTITVTSVNGFTGLVNLSTNSTSCNISPTSVTGSGSSTLSCNFASEGVSTITVTGTSGSLSHSTTATYTIQDFTLTTNSTSIDVNAGATSNSTVTVTALQGFNGLVSLATNSTACTVFPTSLFGSGSSALSCVFPSASTVQVTVTGTSDSLSHSIGVTFIVQDFTVVASPTNVTVNARTPANSTIQITGLNGFAGVVTLTTNSTWCTLTPGTITGSGNANLSCTQSVAGTYTVTITGTSDSLTHTAMIEITVQPGGSVGGMVLPTDKLRLLSQILPVLALIATVAAVGVIAVRTRAKRENQNAHLHEPSRQASLLKYLPQPS